MNLQMLSKIIFSNFCLMHCKDIVDLFGIPGDSFGWLTAYLDHEVSKYVQFLTHRQYHSLQSCLYRLMRNKLKWGFCLEPPEVFVNLHNSAKAVTIIGQCGSILESIGPLWRRRISTIVVPV